MMSSVGGKRPFEGTIEAGAPAPKRAAPNKNEEVFRFCKWGETEIPIDVITHIVSFLSKREIFRFSALAKGAGVFTETCFKEMKKQKYWNCSFLGDEKESYPERASYVSIRVLIQYVKKREALIKNPDSLPISPRPPETQIKALYQEFREIMRYVSCSLGRFIWKDLNSMAPLSSQDEKLFLEGAISQPSESASSVSLAGEELLKGLFHLTVYCDLIWKSNQNQAFLSLGKALPHLESAIRFGATAGSCLAIRVLSPLSSATNEYCKNLAITSASHKDYRGVSMLLNKKMMDAGQAYQAGLHYPPILSALAFQKITQNAYGGIKQVDHLFEEAIKGYEDPLFISIPAKVWLYAGLNKSKLGDYKKAEEYAERALKEKNLLASEDQSNMWLLLMHTRIELRKWKEAEKCCKELFMINFLSGAKPLTCLTYAKIALIKANRGKWEEVNLFLGKAISDPIPVGQSLVWKIATDIKILDERWEEAEQFMQKYMNGVNLPDSDSLVSMARIKYHVKEWPEAKTYIDKALAAYQTQIPPEIEELANQINAKCSSCWQKN